MEDDWDAADDDLEKLLDFDDLNIPSASKSDRIHPLCNSSEARTKSISSPQVSYSSGLHATEDGQNSGGLVKSTELLSAPASEPDRYDLGSRAQEFDANSALITSRYSQGGTQLASRLTGTERESSRRPEGAQTREEARSGTEAICIGSAKDRAEVTVSNDRERRRNGVLESTENLQFMEVSRDKVGNGGPSSGRRLQNSVTPTKQALSSDHLANRGDDHANSADVVSVSGSDLRRNVFDRDSHESVDQPSKRLCHVPNQAGRKGFESRQTGDGISTQGRQNSSDNADRMLASTAKGAQDLPVASPCVPNRVGCGPLSKGQSPQEIESSPERGNSPPPEWDGGEGLPYRIPGPAGALQGNFRKRTSKAAHESGRKSFEMVSQSGAADFQEGPWITAMEYLNCGVARYLPKATISAIKSFNKHLKHIPELVVVIKTVTPNGFGDLFVILKDPTGTINGCVHRSVLTESKYGHGFSPGSVLILRKVTVFSPNPYAHYLNIVAENIYKVFITDAGVSRSQARVVNDNSSKNYEGDQTRADYLSAGRKDIPTEVNPTQGAQETQLVKNSAAHLKRQRVSHDDVDSENAQQIRTIGTRSPTSAKECAKSATPHGILNDSQIRDLPVRNGNVSIKESVSKTLSQMPFVDMEDTQESDEKLKATQEAVVAAKAKEAGWDFGEDVELLLNDDLDGFLM